MQKVRPNMLVRYDCTQRRMQLEETKSQKSSAINPGDTQDIAGISEIGGTIYDTGFSEDWKKGVVNLGPQFWVNEDVAYGYMQEVSESVDPDPGLDIFSDFVTLNKEAKSRGKTGMKMKQQ